MSTFHGFSFGPTPDIIWLFSLFFFYFTLLFYFCLTISLRGAWVCIVTHFLSLRTYHLIWNVFSRLYLSMLHLRVTNICLSICSLILNFVSFRLYYMSLYNVIRYSCDMLDFFCICSCFTFIFGYWKANICTREDRRDIYYFFHHFYHFIFFLSEPYCLRFSYVGLNIFYLNTFANKCNNSL